MISAQILADSLDPRGNRLTTFKVTFPRIILAEFNTHRMFSRNSASSRAIPFNKMVEMVEENPFVPIAWQKDHKGMQGTEYFTDPKEIHSMQYRWIQAAMKAIEHAKWLNSGLVDDPKGVGVTKQLVNRLLEPFMWHTVIITSGSEGLENFFKLRNPVYEIDTDKRLNSRKEVSEFLKEQGVDTSNWTEEKWQSLNKSQAEIHIQALAEAMWDVYNLSEPEQLDERGWHIPFSDEMDLEQIYQIVVVNETWPIQPVSMGWYQNKVDEIKRMVAVARCARISYETLGDDPKVDHRADVKLYERLIQNHHASPLEHVAMCAEDDNMYYNLKGFKSLRYLMRI